MRDQSIFKKTRFKSTSTLGPSTFRSSFFFCSSSSATARSIYSLIFIFDFTALWSHLNSPFGFISSYLFLSFPFFFLIYKLITRSSFRRSCLLIAVADSSLSFKIPVAREAAWSCATILVSGSICGLVAIDCAFA